MLEGFWYNWLGIWSTARLAFKNTSWDSSVQFRLWTAGLDFMSVVFLWPLIALFLICHWTGSSKAGPWGRFLSSNVFSAREEWGLSVSRPALSPSLLALCVIVDYRSRLVIPTEKAECYLKAPYNEQNSVISTALLSQIVPQGAVLVSVSTFVHKLSLLNTGLGERVWPFQQWPMSSLENTQLLLQLL